MSPFSCRQIKLWWLHCLFLLFGGDGNGGGGEGERGKQKNQLDDCYSRGLLCYCTNAIALCYITPIFLLIKLWKQADRWYANISSWFVTVIGNVLFFVFKTHDNLSRTFGTRERIRWEGRGFVFLLSNMKIHQTFSIYKHTTGVLLSSRWCRYPDHWGSGEPWAPNTWTTLRLAVTKL